MAAAGDVNMAGVEEQKQPRREDDMVKSNICYGGRCGLRVYLMILPHRPGLTTAVTNSAKFLILHMGFLEKPPISGLRARF